MRQTSIEEVRCGGGNGEMGGGGGRVEREKGRMVVAKFHGGTHAGRERSMFLCLFVCLDADVLIDMDLNVWMCGCSDVQACRCVDVVGSEFGCVDACLCLWICLDLWMWICGCRCAGVDV